VGVFGRARYSSLLSRSHSRPTSPPASSTTKAIRRRPPRLRDPRSASRCVAPAGLGLAHLAAAEIPNQMGCTVPRGHAACVQRRGDTDDWSLRIPPCTRPHRGVDCTGTSAPCGGCSVEVADPISTRTEPQNESARRASRACCTCTGSPSAEPLMRGFRLVLLAAWPLGAGENEGCFVGPSAYAPLSALYGALEPEVSLVWGPPPDLGTVALSTLFRLVCFGGLLVGGGRVDRLRRGGRDGGDRRAYAKAANAPASRPDASKSSPPSSSRPQSHAERATSPHRPAKRRRPRRGHRVTKKDIIDAALRCAADAGSAVGRSWGSYHGTLL